MILPLPAGNIEALKCSIMPPEGRFYLIFLVVSPQSFAELIGGVNIRVKKIAVGSENFEVWCRKDKSSFMSFQSPIAVFRPVFLNEGN